jgi:cytochrome c556
MIAEATRENGVWPRDFSPGILSLEGSSDNRRENPFMKSALRLVVVATMAAAVAGTAVAQAGDAAVKARKSHMTLFGFNLGPLGAMARGDAEYDAERASLHAGNIAALASVSMAGYWPEGTALGEVEGSRSLPALWQNPDDVMARAATLNEAAAALSAAAGTDLASLQGAMGQLGQACSGCHEQYRAPD